MAIFNFVRSARIRLCAPRTGILVVTVVASVLSGSTVWSRVRTTASDPNRLRYEAPIGHRQPRPQDLPWAVRQKEQHLNADQGDQGKVDRLINRSICTGC